ncbi:MAG TPA: DUF971 domain-containing protein [Candidatus Poseidoniales archaeon]|jgi:DUF971 family protein|nr:MAG: hypothetical protein CXT69_06360 [Euryarchaeota archaeon]HIG03200.1 DUF971 domain-containing protein [Candidatus Poseidoniales archaeon]HIK78201.1 DUF971 domain-containing protein [Candidatus Poseidoniales archaeon]
MSENLNLVKLERMNSEMELTWSDGSINTIAYPTLRFWCPCAKCGPRRDEEELSNQFQVEVDSLPTEKPIVNPVGGYALHFEWSDGCSSGIFRFERLHDIALGENPDGGKPYTHGAW